VRVRFFIWEFRSTPNDATLAGTGRLLATATRHHFKAQEVPSCQAPIPLPHQLPKGAAYLTTIDLDGEGGNVFSVILASTVAIEKAGWGTPCAAKMFALAIDADSYEEALWICICHAPVRFTKGGKAWAPKPC
jgi:hypothetical protein